jgi:hypothetical protein
MFRDRAPVFGFKGRRYRCHVKFAGLLLLLIAVLAWAFDFPALSGAWLIRLTSFLPPNVKRSKAN